MVKETPVSRPSEAGAGMLTPIEDEGNPLTSALTCMPAYAHTGAGK